MVATLAQGPTPFGGSIAVPPSKSMAHRMLLCASLAGGVSHIQNLDYSQDILATLGAVRQLGATIVQREGGVEVEGFGGRGGMQPPTGPVNCNESGSTFRFVIPLFGLLDAPVAFTGSARLMQRPLDAYAHIFEEQGLPFCLQEGALHIHGPLRAGHFALAGNVSSQFVSGLLFALPLLEDASTLTIAPPFESRSYVELTRSAQALFGVHSEWADATTLHIPGGQCYRPAAVAVEGDWSQAVVPAVLSAVRGGVAATGLSATSAQGDRVLLDILARCGAAVAWEGDTLRVTPPAGLLHTPGAVDLADCPDLGPVLCALALFCEGQTTFVNAGRLRIKESDRIAAVQAELSKFGGRISSTEDTITVQGGAPLHAAEADAHNDHRIVMAVATAALCAGVPATIHGAEAVRKSWPGFFEELRRLGAEVTTE